MLTCGQRKMIAETTEWLEAVVKDQEQSWCPKCKKKPVCFYVVTDTLFTDAHRCCATCKTPLTAPEED